MIMVLVRVKVTNSLIREVLDLSPQIISEYLRLMRILVAQ